MLGRDPCPHSTGISGRSEPNDQLGIAQHGNIGVVSRKNELSTSLGLSHSRHDTFRDKPVVEIVFGLIDDQRRVGGPPAGGAGRR